MTVTLVHGAAFYPLLLRAVPDAPPTLYVRGTLAPRPCVACVGTREPSAFGVEVTRRIVRALVARGYGIVSGLALGVDTVAHRTALEAGGYTIAVLAHGLDSVYPAANRELAKEIVAAGGALVGEHPDQTSPSPRSFVRRNRIQSGLALATVVMQTDLAGGTMHTARFALVQGRPLFVPVPPPGVHRDAPKSRGIVALAEWSTARLLPHLRTSAAEGAALAKRLRLAVPIRGREDYAMMFETIEGGAR